MVQIFGSTFSPLVLLMSNQVESLPVFKVFVHYPPYYANSYLLQSHLLTFYFVLLVSCSVRFGFSDIRFSHSNGCISSFVPPIFFYSQQFFRLTLPLTPWFLHLKLIQRTEISWRLFTNKSQMKTGRKLSSFFTLNCVEYFSYDRIISIILGNYPCWKNFIAHSRNFSVYWSFECISLDISLSCF